MKSSSTSTTTTSFQAKLTKSNSIVTSSKKSTWTVSTLRTSSLLSRRPVTKRPYSEERQSSGKEEDWRCRCKKQRLKRNVRKKRDECSLKKLPSKTARWNNNSSQVSRRLWKVQKTSCQKYSKDLLTKHTREEPSKSRSKTWSLTSLTRQT